MLNALRESGINVRGLKKDCTLIINAMPHEVGMDGHRYLIEEFTDVMVTGLNYLKKQFPQGLRIGLPHRNGLDCSRLHRIRN